MLSLSETEKKRVQEFLDKWGYNVWNDIEEDACGTRSYHFEVIPSGIGDLIYLCYEGNREFISDVDNL